MTIERRECVQINMPHMFSDPEFVQWLNSRIEATDVTIATWHTVGEPTEYSDIFTHVCTKGSCEGSDDDMPKKYFKEICEAVGPGYEGIVWITNLEE